MYLASGPMRLAPVYAVPACFFVFSFQTPRLLSAVGSYTGFWNVMIDTSPVYHQELNEATRLSSITIFLSLGSLSASFFQSLSPQRHCLQSWTSIKNMACMGRVISEPSFRLLLPSIQPRHGNERHNYTSSSGQPLPN
ncbi:hypothetical protein DER44DRAFT_330316 [Fusarium oxysporum]|nr:hypothetical protein DER44DRAFT_330316 [Fusarium oxysporum]